MISILLALFSFFFATSADAIAKFNTVYQIYYKVEETGNTHVTIAITQKNNLSVVFATDYGISLSQTQISNVRVSDDGKLAKPEVNTTQNQTSITFPFVNKVVGKDKVHKFSIEYDTKDITNKIGNTWQINIPRLESDENISDHTAIVTLPNSFEKPSYLDPKPDLINDNTYYFSSKVLANRPISLIIGQNQYYKAQLRYSLENDQNEKIKTEIALPPQTAYQDVYYEEIKPKPKQIKTDIDGNLLAEYELGPKENLSVNAKLYFKMSFLPKPRTVDPGQNTQSNVLWDYDNILFTSEKLGSLTTPKSIYDFVSSTLKYDFQKIGRNGNKRVSASQILNNPQSAICTDYTDLFVTLSRKVGIPAREVEGLAISDNPSLKPIISSNTDVLHAWPEYYDSKKMIWVQVDPTWGSTTRGIDYFGKLDLSHLTFAIHGQDPEYPIPAGGYKSTNKTDRDVIVEANEAVEFPKPSLSFRYLGREKNQFVIEVTNLSGVYFDGDLEIEETDSNFKYSDRIVVAPFGTSQIKFFQKDQIFLKVSPHKAIIKTDGQTYQLDYLLTPNLPKTYLLAGGGLVLGVITLIAWRLLFRR